MKSLKGELKIETKWNEFDILCLSSQTPQDKLIASTVEIEKLKAEIAEMKAEPTSNKTVSSLYFIISSWDFQRIIII